MKKSSSRRAAAPAHADADSIRRQVLLGLAGYRTGGFHFPGYFLNIDWPVIRPDHVEGTLLTAPHCSAADGTVNLAAFGVLLDTSVAIASRLHLPAGDHQATVHLHAQFTGRPLRGELRSTAVHVGHTTGARVRQALMRATVTADGADVCHAMGAFINYPAPAGISHGTPPHARVPARALRPLAVEELNAEDRRIAGRADAALRRVDAQHAFLDHFWHMLPRPAPGGARCRVTLGAHFGNRTGDVQGGVLFGIAAATARAAVPGHPQLSNISTWFTGPGRGERLMVRSRVLQAGRSFAAVRTEITRPGGARVLEAVTQHAA